MDELISSRTVIRMLNKYCDRVLNGAHTYYQFKYDSFNSAYKEYKSSYRYKDRKTKTL